MDDIYIGGKSGSYEPESDDIYFSPQNNNNGGTSPNKPQKHGDEARREKPKKHSRLSRRIRAAVLVLVLLCSIAVGMVYRTFSSVNYNKTGHSENVFLDEGELTKSPFVKNILLIGVDRRNSDESSRSDTMLMLSIDKKHRKIKLTSFMRDSYVYIPERKRKSKLNAACRYGGAQMVMDTIEYNFNVQIDHYMLVDFTMFEDIINSVGGIKVEVTEKEAQYMRDKVHLKNVTAGDAVELNGKEALWYCRIRALDSDFMRTQRQRKVITALISKIKHTNPISLYNIAGDIIAQLETDMTPAALTRLALSGVLQYLRYDVQQGRIPTDGAWKNKKISGQAVLELDMGKNTEYLKSFIYGDEEITQEN